MIKGDKGKKIWGLIVILAIIVSVFGGAVSAEDLSGEVTQSVTDVEIETEVDNLSSEELTEALDAVMDDSVNIEFADQSSRSSYDRQAAYN